MKNLTDKLFLSFALLTSILSGQEIFIDSIQINNLTLNIGKAQKTFNWEYSKGDTLEFFIKEKEKEYWRDYNKDTFKISFENTSKTKNTFEVFFCDKESIPLYSFNFNNNFNGIRSVTRSFRYDMTRTANTGTVSKIRIVSREDKGSIKIRLPLLHLKRKKKRIKTSYNRDVGGFYSDSSYYYYNENRFQNEQKNKKTESNIDNIFRLRKIYLDLLSKYIPGIECGAIEKAIDYKKDLSGFIKENKNEISPENIGLDLLRLVKKTLSEKNIEENKIKLITEIIALVDYNGFGNDTEFISNQYKVREYFQALLLIYNYVNTNTKNKIRKTLKWQLKVNKIFESEPIMEPIISDLIRNQYLFLLGYGLIVLKDDSDFFLKSFSSHLSKITSSKHFYSWLKSDGSSFHHKSMNLPYTYSFNELGLILDILHNSPYQLEKKYLDNITRCVIATFLMSKNGHYTNNVSGRHPFDTKNPVCISALETLQKLKIDVELKIIINLLLNNESKLQGFWAFNYSNVGVYRKNDFLVIAKGFTDVFWGSEIYASENRFGRYQGYGTLEIINNEGFSQSGFAEQGWDWNRPAGSTTIALPWAILEPNKNRVDEFAQTNFAGSLSFEKDITNNLNINNTSGVFGFDFKERKNSDNHNNSFSFKKSYFFVEEYIVSLGSNISLKNSVFPANTNIFQKKADENSFLHLNGRNIAYNDSLILNKDKDKTILVKEEKESYIIYDYDELHAVYGSQYSPLGDKSQYLEGTFKKIYLSHGTKPKNSGYEYLVLLHNADKGLLKKEKIFIRDKPYEILQKNYKAHIMKVKSSKRVNYVIFEPYKSELENDILISTSSSLLFSTKPLSANKIEVNLSKPSIRYNSMNMPKPNKVEIKLKGKYKFEFNDKETNIKYDSENNTVLNFTFSEGEEIFFTLMKE